jgi:hypothetical protein
MKRDHEAPYSRMLKVTKQVAKMRRAFIRVADRKSATGNLSEISQRT